MSDAPERICIRPHRWASAEKEDAYWTDAIEYVRADLAALPAVTVGAVALREGSMKMSARVCRMVAEKLPKEHHEGALECERAILALIQKGAAE